jgi:hypothetical protein
MRLAPAFLILALAACGDWKQDPAALTARGAPAAGLSCAACHNYPPQDSNHLYHLYEVGPNKYANGPVTCLDCHYASLQHREVAVADTLFLDPSTNPAFHIVQSSVDWPVGSPPDSFALVIRSWKIDSIQMLTQTHPIPRDGTPLAGTGLADFMTGLAHLNDSVDVVFNPDYDDTARFGGERAAFHPKEETCSAVSCHPTDGPYRFAAPSKGLPGLR